MEIIEKYPDKPWDWKKITYNENCFTIELYDKFHDDWNIYYIAQSFNKISELFDKFPNKPWDFISISNNKNLKIETIEKYPDKPGIGLSHIIQI